MINVKRGTQTWSTADQTASLRSAPTPSQPLVKTTSASDMEKAFGEQAVGDVLNKLADPNWVDPAKKMRATGNDQLDKDAFFKLMLAQMKNQDPTSPMESHQMAAQLAQFSSLESLQNINTGIESLQKTQSGDSQFGALGLIGKVVSGDAAKLYRSQGDKQHALQFSIAQDAQKANAVIKDLDGRVIRKLELGSLKKGTNSVEWNGLMDDGLPARAGEYKVTIEAVGASGAKLAVNTGFSGRISGVDFTPQGPMVIVNGKAVRLSEIKKIEDPSVATTETRPHSSSNSPKGVAPLEVPGAPEAASAPALGGITLDEVPMASGLMAKVQSELSPDRPKQESLP